MSKCYVMIAGLVYKFEGIIRGEVFKLDVL